MKRRVWPVLLVSGLGLALLLWLGTWQLQRLAWKNQLISDYDRAIASEPVPLETALEQFLGGKRIDGMKVTATGKFAPREPLRLLTSTSAGPAWELVHGFEPITGRPVLVNRGKLPHNQNPPAPTNATVDIVGHIVWHDQGRGFFDVDNNPQQNIWYWWDMIAMANQFSATHLDPNYVVVDLVPGSPGTEGLTVEAPKANLRNNHLGYAITWFGLALALVVMTALFLYRPRHPDESRDLSKQ
jgi:surfeit locus 1 family protein